MAEATADQTITEEQKSILNQLAKEDLQRKLTDGKLERAKTKEEREKELMVVVGGKKKGGKKPKKENV